MFHEIDFMQFLDCPLLHSDIMKTRMYGLHPPSPSLLFWHLNTANIIHLRTSDPGIINEVLQGIMAFFLLLQEIKEFFVSYLRYFASLKRCNNKIALN